MDRHITQVVRAWLPASFGEKHQIIGTLQGRSFRAGDILVRCLVGGLLLVASIFKGYGHFATGVAAAPVYLPAWMTAALVPAEIILALSLLAGVRPRMARILTLTLFSAFACYSLRAALLGRPSCGCFGPITSSPWVMFVIDVGVIAILIWWRLVANRPAVFTASDPDHAVDLLQTRYSQARLSLIAGLAACLAIGASAGWLASQYRESTGNVASGEIYIAEPVEWIGKELPLLPHIDIGQDLLGGEWIVLLYHHDCPKCQDAVAEYERGVRHLDPSSPRIALVEVPPWDPDATLTDSACRRGRLDDSRSWFVQTPAHLLLSSGVVLQVSDDVLEPKMLLGEASRSESFVLNGSRERAVVKRRVSL